jgi:hypothetical protein
VPEPFDLSKLPDHVAAFVEILNNNFEGTHDVIDRLIVLLIASDERIHQLELRVTALEHAQR